MNVPAIKHIYVSTNRYEDGHKCYVFRSNPFYRIMPLLMFFTIFSAMFTPNAVKFDPWVLHKKRSDNVYSSFFFSGRVLGLGYVPLKFTKEKKSLL